jgi:hypothetical protein
MPLSTRALTRFALLAAAAASVLPLFGAVADASPSRSAVALPAPVAAQTIVSKLWTQREHALAALDPSALGASDTGVAQELDGAYVNAVLCGCNAAKDRHPVVSVLADVPTSSVQPVFFAQVLTTNPRTKQRPWYVVAVAREAGQWKLAFVTLGSYTKAPPIPGLGAKAEPTAPVTASLHARMTRMAIYDARQVSAQDAGSVTNSYGGTVTTVAKIETAKDGVYGLALTSGTLLSCFTLHTLGTTTLAGGLQQDAAQRQWGKTLAPGDYKSVTVDTATPQCMVGTGTGATPGKLTMQYDDTTLGVTGLPM